MSVMLSIQKCSSILHDVDSLVLLRLYIYIGHCWSAVRGGKAINELRKEQKANATSAVRSVERQCDERSEE